MYFLRGPLSSFFIKQPCPQRFRLFPYRKRRLITISRWLQCRGHGLPRSCLASIIFMKATMCKTLFGCAFGLKMVIQ